MFSSLRFRLWLSYALIVVTALSVVALILFFYLLRNPLPYRQTIQRLSAAQALILKRDETRPLESVARNVALNFDARVLLFDSNRNLILDTAAGKEPALPLPQRRLPSSVPLARDESGAAWLYSQTKLADGGRLVVATPRPRLSVLNLFSDDFLPAILQSGLIALLLSLAAAFLIARWIADPLQKIVAAARAMPEAEIAPVAPQGPHEARELARAFNAMTERVRQSSQSQRDFVANVSHELKTPLTSIQGFAQAILDGAADTPEARQQAAQIIYDESARMNRLVLDLLDLAKMDAGAADITMSRVSLPALLRGVAEKFSPQALKAGVEILVKAEASLPKLTADGDRLAQVFTNLVDNALKFTPRGGSVTLAAAPEADGVSVSVSDTGAGIASDALPHVFDRFYQADPARKGGAKHGAGLGLAIALAIVRAHKGRLTVRSQPGTGASFEVFLPYNGRDSRP